jgi:agmatine/peptidylarginine deiminase
MDVEQILWVDEGYVWAMNTDGHIDDTVRFVQ